MRDEDTRAAARERQARHRARERQHVDDLRFVLEFVARRHIEDLEAAVLELADTTDRDPNQVFPLKRDSRPRDSERQNRQDREEQAGVSDIRQLVGALADAIRDNERERTPE